MPIVEKKDWCAPIFFFSPLRSSDACPTHRRSNEVYRPSLFAFGLTSKICRKATYRLVFREIHLAIRGPKALERDVDALTRLLSETESAVCVRHVCLKGSLLPDIDELDELRERTKTPKDLDWSKDPGIDEVLGDDEPFLNGRFDYDEPSQISPEEDMEWAPVVNFVNILPQLTELVYDCRNQFQPSLLNAVHRHHPQCKSGPGV